MDKASLPAIFRDHSRALAPEKTFEYRPAERADVIGSGARVARVAQHLRLRHEGAVAGYLEKNFLV